MLEDWRHRLATRGPVIAVAGAGLGLLGLSGIAPATWMLAAIPSVLAAALLLPGGEAPSGALGSRSHGGASGNTQHPSATEPIWQQLLDGCIGPAFMLDRENVVLGANAAARTLFAMSPGRRLAEVTRAPPLLNALEQALRDGSSQPFEMRMTVPVERLLTGLATPLRLPGPGEPALLVALLDQTEQDRLGRMRADFVANASHELRTPLASLKGFIETLQGAAKDDAPARDRFLAIMQVQAERMARLIDDLLSLSRIEMREHVAPRDVVDLAAVVDSAVDALKSIAAEAGIRIEWARPSEPLRVTGDRDELVQVVSNLVQNAIKYGRRGGRVSVSIVRQGDGTAIEVVDDGIGIAAEHLPRLTERFYRVNAKDSRERGGTGLGLAIVKHIVNRHQGDLRIASVPGQGSTFTVRLPAEV